MADHLIASWKQPDEDAAWYEKPLHGVWYKGEYVCRKIEKLFLYRCVSFGYETVVKLFHSIRALELSEVEFSKTKGHICLAYSYFLYELGLGF